MSYDILCSSILFSPFLHRHIDFFSFVLSIFCFLYYISSLFAALMFSIVCFNVCGYPKSLNHCHSPGFYFLSEFLSFLCIFDTLANNVPQFPSHIHIRNKAVLNSEATEVVVQSAVSAVALLLPRGFYLILSCIVLVMF